MRAGVPPSPSALSVSGGVGLEVGPLSGRVGLAFASGEVGSGPEAEPEGSDSEVEPEPVDNGFGLGSDESAAEELEESADDEDGRVGLSPSFRRMRFRSRCRTPVDSEAALVVDAGPELVLGDGDADLRCASRSGRALGEVPRSSVFFGPGQWRAPSAGCRRSPGRWSMLDRLTRLLKLLLSEERMSSLMATSFLARSVPACACA